MTDRDARPAGTRSIEALTDEFRGRDYITDRSLATAVFLALELGRPLLLEGEAGVGKTELAKVLAASLGAPLIRLQCYEGLDVNTAVYEWNYPRQMLEIRLLEARGEADRATAHDIFGPDFLIRRPLLQALESTDGVAPVLLIDEIDRADEEFEAYLLEILSDFQVTVPEIGTIKAELPPRVILTSNRTREVHDALKRRCLYHWIDYPTAQKEFEIVLARVPEAPERLAREVVGLRPSPARGRPDQGPRHRRDPRLGGRPPVARGPRADARARRRDPRRRPQVRGGHPPGQGRRRPGATWPRPPPAAERDAMTDPAIVSVAIRRRGGRSPPARRGGRVRAGAAGRAPVDRPRGVGRLRAGADPRRHRRPRAGPRQPVPRSSSAGATTGRPTTRSSIDGGAGAARAWARISRRRRCVGRTTQTSWIRMPPARRQPEAGDESQAARPEERGIAHPDRGRATPRTRNRRSKASSSRPTPTRRARSCATVNSTG